MAQIKPPSKQTLKKYGLGLADWVILFDDCEGTCPICERKFGKTYGNAKRPLSPCIDHEHVKGFARMSAERKRRYVRGLCCLYCNRRRIGRGLNIKIARNIVRYFERYEARIREVE